MASLNMIEINLLPQELKTKAKKFGIDSKSILYFILLAFGIIIFVHIYLFAVTVAKNCQLRLLNNKWEKLEPQRKILGNFKNKYEVLSADAETIQQLITQRINCSEKLNKLSINLPSGVWFNELAISSRDFTLKGSVVSLQKEEMVLINKFMNNLKNDAGFLKDFNNLELSSIKRVTVSSYDIVDFILAGNLKTNDKF